MENVLKGNDDELFISLRGFLIFGRVIGLFPYNGMFSGSSSHLQFKWLSVPSLFTYFILSIITFNTLLEFIDSISLPKGNAYELAQCVRTILYNLWTLFVYYNFIFRSKEFLNIFYSWRFTTVHFYKPDIKLKRDTIFIAVLVLTSGALENVTLYGDLFKRLIRTTNTNSTGSVSSIIQDEYSQFNRSWARFFNYHPFFYILIFIQHKFILFAWNSIDVLLALLGRALYFKFKAVNQMSKQRLVRAFKDKSNESVNYTNLHDSKVDCEEWKKVVKDHISLIELVLVFEKFMSPLIFLSYMVNIYYVSMQLLDGLTLELRNPTVWIEINRPWSFVHLVVRMYFLSICCARVNEEAHQISKVIKECPPEFYSTDISRLDKRVNGGRDIGLTGLQAFTVTKPFILAVIGVIFTAEIILLQIVPDLSGSQGKKCCCK